MFFVTPLRPSQYGYRLSTQKSWWISFAYHRLLGSSFVLAIIWGEGVIKTVMTSLRSLVVGSLGREE